MQVEHNMDRAHKSQADWLVTENQVLTILCLGHCVVSEFQQLKMYLSYTY